VLVKPILLADEQPNLSHSKILLQSNGVLYQMDGEFQIGPQKSTKTAKRGVKQ
jgi:hypothetical protein